MDKLDNARCLSVRQLSSEEIIIGEELAREKKIQKISTHIDSLYFPIGTKINFSDCDKYLL